MGFKLQQGVETEAKAEFRRRALAEKERRRAERFETYQTEYEPKLREYGEAAEQAARSTAEREMAKARLRLGYAASVGPGTGGGWMANRLALERAAIQKQQDIGQAGERFLQQSYLGYMEREDVQAHQMQMAKLQFQAQLEMAERLDPSWWDGLMQIAGLAGGLYLGYKAFGGGSYV